MKKVMTIASTLATIGLLMVFTSGCMNKNDSSNLPTEAAMVSDGVQTITTKITSNSYPPITVQKGIPVKWTIQADAKDINNCNNEIISNDFGFDKKLVSGSNEITFTPEKTGTYIYTCWMGMLSSTITVVDDINTIVKQDIDDYNAAASLSGGGSSCNMGGTSNGNNKGGGCCGR